MNTHIHHSDPWWAVSIIGYLSYDDAISFSCTCPAIFSKLNLRLVSPCLPPSSKTSHMAIWSGTDNDDHADRFCQTIDIANPSIFPTTSIVNYEIDSYLSSPQVMLSKRTIHSVVIDFVWKAARPARKAWHPPPRDIMLYVVRRRRHRRQPMSSEGENESLEETSMVVRTSEAPPRADLQAGRLVFLLEDDDESFVVSYELWCRVGRGRRGLQVGHIMTRYLVYDV